MFPEGKTSGIRQGLKLFGKHLIFKDESKKKE
jgi:hypothetical protein